VKKTAIIFDFDYTLAFSEPAILACFHHVLDGLGIASDDDAIRRTIGLTLEQAFEILAGEHDPDRLVELRKRYVAHADKIMVALTEFYPEAIPLMRELTAQGYKVCVMSTKYRYRIEASFVKEGIRELLYDIVGGEDITAHKPDPMGIEVLLKRNGWSADECVYVGDNVVDGEAARRIGVDFVGVAQGTTTEEELAAYPHLCVGKNLTAVKQALKNL